MKTYSVREIAELLHTNPETVRRWIRSGKLKADQTSRKDGNSIREEELYKFLCSTAKYAGTATALASTNPALALTNAIRTGIVGAGVAGVMLASLTGRNSKENAQILSDDLRKTIRRNILDSKKTIERKKKAIAELKAEISQEQQRIHDYETALKHLADTLPVIKNIESEEGVG